jgi:hypothetical protein
MSDKNKIQPDKIKSITKGTVWLQKDGQSGFQPVSAGAELSPHDILKTSEDAVVTLKCRNGTEQTVAKGTEIPVLRICTSPSLKPRRLVNRSGLDPDIPYIISPLDTHILTDKPTLRWNLATGAKKFTVTVQNEELEWTVEVSREQVCQGNVCELVYPSDKPPLQPGVSYTLLVKADANHSSAEDAPQKFTRLDAQKAEEVEIITKQIEEEDLPATAKKIKLSDYYADYKLIAEAIEILEELSKQEKSIPVYLRIGILYSSIGLVRKAEVAYNEAMELPQLAENTPEIAAVKVGLGEVKFALKKKQEAVGLLEKAKTDYEKLGDAEQIEELEKRIAEISDMK